MSLAKINRASEIGKTSAVTTALPHQPHSHENRKLNEKCKCIVGHIAEINIRSREISSGGVEMLSDGEGCVTLDRGCAVNFGH